MKLNVLPLIFSLLLIIATFSPLQAQLVPEWKFVGEISFPAEDTLYVTPYLCTVDDNGRLYVISSRATRVDARNAVFYVDEGDSIFTKMIDYYLNGDSDTLTGNVGALRGIAAIGTDVIVNSNVPFPRGMNTVASQYYYPNGDTTQVKKFGFYHTGSGYGTYIHGLAVTSDSIAITGITFNTSIRFYNFSSVEPPAYGSWVPLSVYPLEPGGPHFNGVDIIRDAAVIKDGDYNNPETPFYTSRNSKSSTEVTGGVTVWAGGTQFDPGSYIGQRVIDAVGLLSFDRYIPYGITVDNNERLWVAGIDSTRRWVKGFEMIGNFATDIEELPAKYSQSNPVDDGAPFTMPADVAFSNDGNTAYVICMGTRKAYKFEFKEPVGIDENINVVYDFTLEQNFPNPFNPSTMIRFTLPESGNVKLTVSNSLGQEVALLVNEFKSAGNHGLLFNADNLTSGIYFYTLTTQQGSISRKMTLVK